MAQSAADDLAARGRSVTRIIASPLQRVQESAEPITKAFGLPIETDERLIEPTNAFEGLDMARALRNPANWWRVRNPRVPSWGEPYTQIVERMMAAVTDAWESTPEGDVIIVSHQLPIWMVHSHLRGIPLNHDPRKRRCALSSITTLEHRGNRFTEVDYRDPALMLSVNSVDVGAV